MNYQLGLFDARLEREFWAFHEVNPRVYAKLREYALQARRSGRRHFGVKAIVERLRWFSRIETQARGEDAYKLNDHHSAFYARLLMENEPELAGFFATRAAVADDGRAA